MRPKSPAARASHWGMGSAVHRCQAGESMAQLIRRHAIERSVCLGRERQDVLYQLRRRHLSMRELLDRVMPLCEEEDDDVLALTHTTIDAIESLLDAAERRWNG